MEENIGYAIRGLTWNDLLLMIKGLRYTVEIALISISLGLVLAIIVGISRSSKIVILNTIFRIYVEIFRGIPVLLQIFLFYYGLRLFNIRFPALFSASIAFIFNIGANVGETLKGVIDSIPKSQWEASSSLGLSQIQQLRYVILPQVVKTAIPPTMGIFVGLIKDTSLASIVGFIELTRAASRVMAMTMNPYTTFPIVAAMYFLICFPLTYYSRKLEHKLER